MHKDNINIDLLKNISLFSNFESWMNLDSEIRKDSEMLFKRQLGNHFVRHKTLMQHFIFECHITYLLQDSPVITLCVDIINRIFE